MGKKAFCAVKHISRNIFSTITLKLFFEQNKQNKFTDSYLMFANEKVAQMFFFNFIEYLNGMIPLIKFFTDRFMINLIYKIIMSMKKTTAR